MEKTLEQMIRDNCDSWGVEASEYIVRVQRDLGEKGLQIYIRPSNRNGETFDLIVDGNTLTKV